MVTDWYQSVFTLSLGGCVCHAFMSVSHVSIILECVLHMHGVGHVHSDVSMGMTMSLCEACCHDYMIGHMLFVLAYCQCTVVWLCCHA